MVSVIFEVVSVWLVIEPWVKFGTTGTAWAGASMALAPTAIITYFNFIRPEIMVSTLHKRFPISR